MKPEPGSGIELLALGGHRASSQTAKKIEQYAPELDGIISSAEPIQELASGTGGTLGPTEGPLWWKEGGYLIYSDIHNNRRMKYVPGQGASVAQEPVNRSNGLTRTVDSHACRLRRKLRDDDNPPCLIKAVRGVGYIFTPFVEDLDAQSGAQSGPASEGRLSAPREGAR